jgi:hypothetical protein
MINDVSPRGKIMNRILLAMTLVSVLSISVAEAETNTCRSFSFRLTCDDQFAYNKTKCEKLQMHPLTNEDEQVWTKKEPLINAKSIEKTFITPDKPLFTQSQILVAKLDPQSKPIPPVD